jgi:hypothetical protein
MRKYTHSLMLGFTLLFVALMVVSNLQLKSAVAAYNFDDPYRNYVQQEIPNFRYVVLYIGNMVSKNTKNAAQPRRAGTAHIRQAEKPSLYIHEDMKDSIQWRVSGDTLYLKGYNSNRRVHSVAEIMAPNIVGVYAFQSNVKIGDFSTDSLAVYAEQESHTEMSNIKARVLYLHLDEATVTITDSASLIKNIRVAKGNNSTLECSNIALDQLHLPDDQRSFSLKMSGDALQLLRRQPQ